jgi:hypothetical protein
VSAAVTSNAFVPTGGLDAPPPPQAASVSTPISSSREQTSNTRQQ